METIIVVERRYLNNINIYDELSNLILNFITEYLSNKYHEVYNEFEDVSCNVYEGGLNEEISVFDCIVSCIFVRM